MKKTNNMELEIKSSLNKMSHHISKLHDVKSSRALTRFIVEESYFKNVYGKSYKEIIEEIKDEFNVIDDDFSVISNMGYLHQTSLLIATRYLTNYITSKEGLSYDLVKRSIFDVSHDISKDIKKHIKEEIEKSGSRDSVYTDLKKSIKLSLETEKMNEELKALDKKEKEKQKFYEEQQRFIEYEEKVHKNMR